MGFEKFSREKIVCFCAVLTMFRGDHHGQRLVCREWPCAVEGLVTAALDRRG